jgi:light-regulated signal transduction histidine kinase (bacteriophytochrome)
LTISQTPDVATEYATPDLTNCDREPIHILGRVQSYGALLALSSGWLVQHASENLSDILGITVEDALGRRLADLLPQDSFARIREALRAVGPSNPVLRLFGIPILGEKAGDFDLSIHQSGRHLIIEFEPKGEQRNGDPLSQVYPYIHRIRRTNDLRAFTREAARSLRALCGFDSVMVYEFAEDASGHVIAEDTADGERRYLDQHFPASDIPVQARVLYKRSLLRLIADVSDPGARILAADSAGNQPLDLSLAATRAVSPIHIEYLQNMGIQASMSVSIMKDGELWGLFACHHDEPRYIDYELRTCVELFAHLFSYELGHLGEAQKREAVERSSQLQTRLMASMAEGRDLPGSLMAVSEDIRSVIPHDGLIMITDGQVSATGVTPTEEEFLCISRLLNATGGSQIFATNKLSQLLPEAADFARRCSGILAIPISRMPRDYIVLCRKELTETVKWAGNPNKPVTVGPNGVRLTPRKSFEIWRETVTGASAPWTLASTHAAELLRVVLLEIFLKITDQTAAERKRAQEQQELLISELNHRVRNILNLMRGLVAQSRGTADTLESFASSLDGRIQAFARAHDQLTKEDWTPSSFMEMLRLEFAAFADDRSNRVDLQGDDVLIAPGAYSNLALVFHELVTNSVKYGALSDSGGVTVKLTRNDDGSLDIHWREFGGPAVVAPKRRGFGSTIIERSIPYELNGEAEVTYNVTGLIAEFCLPSRYVLDAPEAKMVAPTSAAQRVRGEGPFLTGKALVLEDAMIIAMDAADMLEDMGASTVRITASVNAALAEIEQHEFQVAVLDVNLGAEQSVRVALKLAEIGVPYVLSTGYGESEDIRALYPPCEILRKPFSNESMQAAVWNVLHQTED